MYENKNIKHVSLSRSSKVLAVEAWGDLRPAFPLSLIRGSYSTNDDISGCVIDADTALVLYGSSDILGKEVVCDGLAPGSIPDYKSVRRPVLYTRTPDTLPLV